MSIDMDGTSGSHDRSGRPPAADGGGSGDHPVSATFDRRAIEALPAASSDVADVWDQVQRVTGSDPPAAGLAAGDRPAADVELLAGSMAAVEYELARRMHLARAAGCLPLHDPGAMLAARGWSVPSARRLARAGALAADHPSVAAAWGAGLITSEHVDAVAKAADRFDEAELGAVLAELAPHWGAWSPRAVAQFVAMAVRMLHPPPDPDPDECDAYESRSLSFAVTRDTVLISGELPRLEGELVIAAIDAFAERLRSTADHVPAAARRADALVELVNTAHASGSLPRRGGLPVSLTVTLDRTELGDVRCVTSRGHLLTEAEARWSACDASISPVLVARPGCTPEPSGTAVAAKGGRNLADGVADAADRGSSQSPGRSGGGGAALDGQPSAAARIAALAALMFDAPQPLAVGRTQRSATPAQRRALAARDSGCIIPGCQIPAEACQTHHVIGWADGGSTDTSNLALLCWAHHRQVDLNMWTIHPAGPASGAARVHAEVSEGVALGVHLGGRPGATWPANNGAPWTIRVVPRSRWRT